MFKLMKLVFTLTLTALVAAACGTQKTEMPQADTASQNPVTLRVYQYVAGISDDEFQRYFIDPVKKKFPNVTLELVHASATGNSMQELIGSNTFPDLIYTSNPYIPDFQAVDLPEELTPSVQKYKLDLGKYNKTAIDTIKIYGNNKGLFALPFAANTGVMVYNKDIFDKLGIPYPKDGMTWQDAVELSKKMTKVVDGTQYIGLDAYDPHLEASELALSYVDPATDKAHLQTDQWKQVLNIYQQLYQIPGYVNNGKYKYGITGFTKDKNVAMYTPYLDMVVNQVSQAKDVNWDFAQLPNFDGRVGQGMQYDEHLLMLSKTSQHKDLAFQIMQLVSSSEDVQLDLMKQGRLTVLNKPEWQSQFASNYPSFKGKNTAAIFKAQMITPHIPTPYDGKVTSVVTGQVMKDLAAGHDLNTVIRDAEDTANKAIDTAKQSAK